MVQTKGLLHFSFLTVKKKNPKSSVINIINMIKIVSV